MTRTKPSGPITPGPDLDLSGVPLGGVRTAADLAACLDRVRVLAGPLSHRELDRLSGGRLGRTKIGQVLAGELPRRGFLATYFEVCGVPAADRPAWYDTWAGLVVGRAVDEPVPVPVREPRGGADAELTALRGELSRATRELADLRGTGDLLRAERDRALAHADALVVEVIGLRTAVEGLTAQRERDQREQAQRVPPPDDRARDPAREQVRALVDELSQSRRRVEELERELRAVREARAHAESEPLHTPAASPRPRSYVRAEADTFSGPPQPVSTGTIGAAGT